MSESVYARLRLSNGDTAFAERTGDELELLSAPPWEGGRRRGERVALAQAVLLAPVSPTKIVCVGHLCEQSFLLVRQVLAM